MKGKDQIKDLFSDKLGNYEAPVNPELWGNIASQIGTAGTAATGTGLSLAAKWIIGVGVASVVTIGAVILSNDSSTSTEEKSKVQLSEQVETKPVIEETEINTPEFTEASNQETSRSQVEDIELTSVQSTILVEEGQERLHVEDDPLNVLLTEERSTEGEELDSEIINKEEEETSSVTPNDTNLTEQETQNSNEEDHTANQLEEEQQENTTRIDPIELKFNVFTPNNDGVNDELFIENIPTEGLQDFVIVVLDQSHNRVFESTDPNFRWSGLNMMGDPVPNGSYVYIVTCKDTEGNDIKQYQVVEIVR